MKAAVLTESNKPLSVVNLELPSALDYGQVLVKVHYSGICGAQINEIEAAKGPDKFLPHLLGHEGSATVVDVGPGVSTVKKGDHVVMHWRPSAGIQAVPPKYNWNGKTVNAGWVTTFNSQAIVSENRLTVIPTDFDMRIAPLFGCAVTTALGVINNDAKVRIGQSVVVFGLGGVGLNLVQAASMVSANPVIGIDLLDSKIDAAKDFGMDHGFNAKTETDIDAKIKALVGEKGADVVIDTTGNGRVIEQAYNLTHPDGKTILVGVPRKTDPITIYSLPLHFKKVLTGSHGGGAVPDEDIPRYIRLMKANKLNFDGLISHEFPLDDINEALALFKSGEAKRILINMDA
jgi:S-(hydroxymethyl)glutathione dehydrogenase / alcohol dehydrogenase